MLGEQSGLTFAIPATDPLGKNGVQGKLFADDSRLLFYWKLEERTFRRAAEEMQTIEIPWEEVEKITLHTTLGFLKPRLQLRIKDPRPLKDVPGIGVGQAELFLTGKGAKSAAKKFLKLVEFQRSNAEVNRRDARLSELEG